MRPRPEASRRTGAGRRPLPSCLLDLYTPRLARRWQVPCHLSLETPMACGFGACFSCVTKVQTTDGWDYKRVCVDGPVFDAAALHWER